MASASYVTGSHAMKFGMTDLWGENSRTFAPNANIDTLIKINVAGLGNEIPFQVVVYNSPATSIQNVNSDFGSYVQDTWTMKRLTLNYGARFEHFNASVPAESSPASTWIGARNFPAIPNVPNWNDWAVRLAAAYDLFGNGKTALKANAGKYVAAQAAGFAQTFNGMSGVTQTVTWTDLDSERHHLDAAGNIEVNEVGPRTANFGQVTVRPDPALPRGYNWEYSAVLQHELFPRVSVTAGFYHRDFYNLQVTDNQNVSTADWTALCRSPRRPTRACRSRASRSRCTRSNADKVGVATDNLRDLLDAEQDDLQRRSSSPRNIRRDKFIVFGGVTTDRLITINCDGSSATDGTSGRDNPNGLRFCDSVRRPRSAAGCPDDGQGVGRVFVPVRHQPERIVLVDSRPGGGRQLHRHVGDRGTPDHRQHRRRSSHRRQPGSAEHACSSTTRTGSTCVSARRSASTARRSRGSRTSSTCSTPARC